MLSSPNGIQCQFEGNMRLYKTYRGLLHGNGKFPRNSVSIEDYQVSFSVKSLEHPCNSAARDIDIGPLFIKCKQTPGRGCRVTRVPLIHTNVL